MDWANMMRPAVVVGFAVVLFLIDGVEAAMGFVTADLSQAWIGALGAVVAAILGWLATKRG